jgi:hypothetical protein
MRDSINRPLQQEKQSSDHVQDNSLSIIIRPMLHKVFLSFLIVCMILPLFAANETSHAFVVIGDSGCGCSGQEAVARRMEQWHSEKPFSVVLMTGDNIYGRDSRRRGGSRLLFEERFDRYYGELMKKGVKFYAALGNHDMETSQGRDEIADRARFNILGKRGYYSFTPDVMVNERSLVTFIALNSVTLGDDAEQVAWLGRTLTDGKSIWEILFFHHPIYTPPGKHEDDVEIRTVVEDVLVAAGVKVTFAGHNHFYARMKPQNGVIHFVTGGGGRSLKTPVKDEKTAHAVESYHFIYVDVTEEKLNFSVVPPAGPPIDTGLITLQPDL